MMTDQEVIDDYLEGVVDSEGIGYVLYSLERVCFAKAQHLRENWQDDHMAKKWEKAATKLVALIDKLPIH